MTTISVPERKHLPSMIILRQGNITSRIHPILHHARTTVYLVCGAALFFVPAQVDRNPTPYFAACVIMRTPLPHSLPSDHVPCVREVNSGRALCRIVRPIKLKPSSCPTAACLLLHCVSCMKARNESTATATTSMANTPAHPPPANTVVS